LVVLGFALRLAVRLYTGAEDFWVNGYGFCFELAHNLAAGKGMRLDGGSPTAFRVQQSVSLQGRIAFVDL
jgi:hypothetical protein